MKPEPLQSDEPHQARNDVVMSCRARLARNIAGFPFVNRSSPAQNREILHLCRNVVLNQNIADGMIWVDVHQASPHERQLLFERHLISRNHVDNEHERAVAISGDERLSIMVNEEDHLRMQILTSGLHLEDVFAAIQQVDDHIEEHVDYAFSPRWGYLTACPTNVGTGIRLSVMLHLPALKITNELDRVRRAARDMHLAVRGFHGEGSESEGDFYQVSNQLTLGRSESDLLNDFRDVILPRIIDYELHARHMLLEQSLTVLDDRVHRARAILCSARLLGPEEAMRLLSRVKLGVDLKRITDIESPSINDLFLQIQTAHLRQHVGTAMTAEQQRAARATLVRETLCNC
jgi:protein arginine kinase